MGLNQAELKEALELGRTNTVTLAAVASPEATGSLTEAAGWNPAVNAQSSEFDQATKLEDNGPSTLDI